MFFTQKVQKTVHFTLRFIYIYNMLLKEIINLNNIFNPIAQLWATLSPSHISIKTVNL